MGHSYSRHYVHIVFATKYRRKLIHPGEMEAGLHAYMAGIINNRHGFAKKINGIADHIHILADLKRDTSVAALVQDVKSYSSRWVNRNYAVPGKFRWQEGYGVFSVNPMGVGRVVRYIERQKVHHRQIIFETEYVALLKKHRIQFDENDLWD